MQQNAAKRRSVSEFKSHLNDSDSDDDNDRTMNPPQIGIDNVEDDQITNSIPQKLNKSPLPQRRNKKSIKSNSDYDDRSLNSAKNKGQ